jgi:plastocyanin
MGRRVSILAVLVVSAVAAAPAAGARTATTVVIRNIDFSRHTVRIHRGESVRWRFADAGVSHNVTSRGRPHFRSSTSMLTGTYTVRFTRPGAYRYVCTIHPNMKGRVIVG